MLFEEVVSKGDGLRGNGLWDEEERGRMEESRRV